VSAAPPVPGLVPPTWKWRYRLTWCEWRSKQLKRGEIKRARKRRTECVNSSPALCSLTESFS
jgi:hypothetical protein